MWLVRRRKDKTAGEGEMCLWDYGYNCSLGRGCMCLWQTGPHLPFLPPLSILLYLNYFPFLVNVSRQFSKVSGHKKVTSQFVACLVWFTLRHIHSHLWACHGSYWDNHYSFLFLKQGSISGSVLNILSASHWQWFGTPQWVVPAAPRSLSSLFSLVDEDVLWRVPLCCLHRVFLLWLPWSLFMQSSQRRASDLSDLK